WWTSTQPDYLAWVADTNLAHETYQAAVGTDYVGLVAAATAADVAYITARADAVEARTIARAGTAESYIHSLAGARETYLTAMATASHDLTSSGDESAHATAVSSAVDAYRSAAATGSGDHRVALATAQKDYSDALHGPGGASQTWQSVVATAVKDFAIADATAYADLAIDLAELDRDFGILSAQTYSDAVAAIAATSPWAALAASEADAEATRTTALLTEEALLNIAQATAARDEAITTATAADALATADSTATSTRAVALAGAAVTRAEEEAAAESSAAGSGAGSVTLPAVGAEPSSLTPGDHARAAGDGFGKSLENWLSWIEWLAPPVLPRATVAAEQHEALPDPDQEPLNGCPLCDPSRLEETRPVILYPGQELSPYPGSLVWPGLLDGHIGPDVPGSHPPLMSGSIPLRGVANRSPADNFPIAEKVVDAGVYTTMMLEFALGEALAYSAMPMTTVAAASGQAPTRAVASAAAGRALVPRGAYQLGVWGEARLARYLAYQGVKPSSAFKTSLGRRFVDRLVNGVAHEAKAGVDVGLEPSIRTQVPKDAELISTGRIKGAHWHFFQGAQKELLDFLTAHGIPYTVH
ncbi:hypothetical protein ACFL5Q_07000, partial [Planctomycetota bacterium]